MNQSPLGVLKIEFNVLRLTSLFGRYIYMNEIFVGVENLNLIGTSEKVIIKFEPVKIKFLPFCKLTDNLQK